MCQPASSARSGADDGEEANSPLAALDTSPVPRTTITWLHFLQRILKTFPRTFSSAMEYLA
jgi:hypothetical protein